MPSGSMVFLVFTGVVTFAVLLQTIILVVVVAGAKQAQQKWRNGWSGCMRSCGPS